MSKTITVYEKPTCTTCRNLKAYLVENGIDYEDVNYYIELFDEAKLRDLLKKMRLSPRDLLRTKDSKYKELGLDSSGKSDDELIAAMVKYPDLIQRPIVERGDAAVLARPIENVSKLL